ncbi:MAG: SusD/RagB family nutrient-binding outer membrane lipoprotein [Dysgonamonadaceae bacterium]|jgi:hypothetical protein|nr:SusD/RagB family nutrient-binding outer membrane lipoprotein [Dysgonamonadaceae bacterium]
MKKNILLTSLLLCLILFWSACTGKYLDFNTDSTGGATDEEVGRDGYAVNATLLGMGDFVVPTAVHLNQFAEVLAGGNLGGYFASINPGFNGNTISTFNHNDQWTRPAFNDVIPQVSIRWNDMRTRTENPVLLAVSDVLRVMAIVRVTDMYGPIPYSKIGINGSLTAPYDTQEDVYKLMFEQLESAIEVLTANRTNNFTPLADNVFRGNVMNWIRLANSMKLRMALRISNVNATLAQQMAEAAVNHEIGVMYTNAHNALKPVVATNPIFMQAHDWSDERVSADIVSFMNGFNDPRRERFFTPATFVGGGFIGMRSGVIIPSTGSGTANFSNINITRDTPIMWMNAAEVSFLKAEGALRGWNMGGSAEGFYNEGIILSFDQWGASGAGQYILDNTSRPATYSDPLGSFSATSPASHITIMWDESATMETNLERIITQKWIAMFPLGVEAWSTYRRTGFPRLMPAIANNSGGVITPTTGGARRLPFPQSEYLENATNMWNAINTDLGGQDNMGTNVWWARR